ncbi:MAG: hypothetical protein RL689_2165 [Planctomycetota bacterium]|jgi:hypothetical protein
MTHLPLEFRDGHHFVEVQGDRWLVDTGAPSSFGTPGQVTIAGEQCSLGASYLGLDAATLSRMVGVPCVGLLGADVLGRFDHLFDVEGGRLTLSTDELAHDGQPIGLDDFLGVPIVTARIGGREHRLFFDTGAQVSYLEDDSIRTFPDAGRLSDFYPGFGPFETDTFDVPLTLGPATFTLRCGTLPDILGMTLMVAGVRGIVGNAILRGRTVGYFPRRGVMSF